MEKEILEKLNTIFFKKVKVNEKHTSIFIYRIFQKSSLDLYAIVFFSIFTKNKKIEYEMTLNKINPLELNSFFSLKNIYDRLIVTPSKVMVDPETKIGFTTVGKCVYPFFNEGVVNKHLVENSSYEMLNKKKFENEQEVKDHLFKNFLNTSRIANDEFLLDTCTQLYNNIMDEINECKKRKENSVNDQLLLEEFKQITEEKDYNNLVENLFNFIIETPEYLTDAIYTCKQKFNKIYDIDVTDVETLKNLSYDDKKYIVIGNQQNVVDFDFIERKEYCYNNIDIIYPIITCLLKSKGIIDEKTNLIGNKYNKLKDEEGIDYSKLN